MRNTKEENIAEHSAQVAMIANALALIDNRIYHRQIDADKVGMAALFHETAEVVTGDMPTPVKYFNAEITNAYKSIERAAEDKLLATLPEALRGDYAAMVQPDRDSYEYKLVKAADKLSAYVKCIEEQVSGNHEFLKAQTAIRAELKEIRLDCVDYFLEHFVGAFSLTLDELSV